MASESNEISVEVVGIFEQHPVHSSQEQSQPVVVLRDVINRELHLPVGSCQGLAVHLALERKPVARPMTHDLAIHLLERLSAHLTRVSIDPLQDNRYGSSLYLDTQDGELIIEAQPGDAIALAIRAEAPIYVREDLMTGEYSYGRDTF